jgi:hypothetical protein
MTYAFRAWELLADTYLLKLQWMQNKVLRNTGNFQKRKPVYDLHTTYNILYVYDYITKLCKQQAEVMRMNMFAVWKKVKADITNIRGLNMVVVKLTTVQMTKLPL